MAVALYMDVQPLLGQAASVICIAPRDLRRRTRVTRPLMLVDRDWPWKILRRGPRARVRAASVPNRATGSSEARPDREGHARQIAARDLPEIRVHREITCGTDLH